MTRLNGLSWSRSQRHIAVAVILLCVLLGLAPYASAAPSAQGGSGQILYGLTTANRLIQFSSANPCALIGQRNVTGLRKNERLVGIDFRPATGQLYGLGSSSRLYTIDPQSGKATQVGAQPFSPKLEGKFFGFDFNPTVDRIRVVSDKGQNLRLHPDLGTVVDADPNTAGIQPDGRLAYDNTDADGDPVDVNAGRRVRAGGAAYTNPDNDPATGTTLYDIDADRDTLATQNPPNNGTLNTVGKLGVKVNELAGFDIGSSNVAYAALRARGSSENDDRDAEREMEAEARGEANEDQAARQDGRCGKSQLFTIDLATGRATSLGYIGSRQSLIGLAVPLR
jgi:hypothetical protein